MFYVFLLAGVFTSGCNMTNSTEIARNELFSLSYGRMEDELSLYRSGTNDRIYKTRVFMTEGGLVYISNPQVNKVMTFSGYGDLLSLLYDPDLNPEPLLLTQPEAKGENRAWTWNFNKAGIFTKTSDGFYLIEEEVKLEQHLTDEESGLLLFKVVTRFNSQGTFLDYIGQEGVGGTPFSYIDDIISTDNSEFLVVTKAQNQNGVGKSVFWYKSNGDLIYRIDFPYDRLPVLQGDEVTYPSIESVFPSLTERSLFLKINYYTEEFDRSLGTRRGVEEKGSYIIEFDLQTATYTKRIKLHSLEPETGQSRNKNFVAYPFEFKGVSRTGHFLLLNFGLHNNTILTVIDPSGKIIHESIILEESGIKFYEDYYVTPKGVLVGLVCGKERIRVFRWRSDLLLKEN